MSAATAPVAESDKPPRRGRWIPLSLRVFAAILSMSFIGGFMSVWLPYHRQQQAIEDIEYRGGDVETEVVGPDWLRQLAGEDLMIKMKVFERVVTVIYGRGKVRDAEIAGVSGLSDLRHLDLSEMPITDAGLTHLTGLPELEILDLSNTEITDAGLANLSGLTKLKFLHLENTSVTDAGLKSLRHLSKLRVLDVRKTRVTDAGVGDLVRALPKLQVE